MQIVRLTPSGLVPVVALSEYMLLIPRDGTAPSMLDKLCWTVYHGEPGPRQWRSRIVVKGIPDKATALNRAAPLFGYEFDLVTQELHHPDGAPRSHARIVLEYNGSRLARGEWLVLCDPMPPFCWSVSFRVTGPVECVDMAYGSYGGWTLVKREDSDDDNSIANKTPRYPMPIYLVKGAATIEWHARPHRRSYPPREYWPVKDLDVDGFVGRATWSRRYDWSFWYGPASEASPSSSVDTTDEESEDVE